MMPGGSVKVYLTKPRKPITDVGTKQQAINPNVFLERDLGTRSKADGYPRIFGARKAPSP